MLRKTSVILSILLPLHLLGCSHPDLKPDAGSDSDDGLPWDIGHDDAGQTAVVDVAEPDVRPGLSDLGAPGLIVTPEVIATSESGDAALIEVALASPPREPVYVAVGPPSLEGMPTPVQLVFNATNFAITQDVTVTGVDDELVDGSQTYILEFTTISDDPRYEGLREVVTVTNLDDDGATDSGERIRVGASTPLITREMGTTATFEVVLNDPPTSDVEVPIGCGDGTEGSCSAPLTFTPANWDVSQTVTITGLDDTIADGTVGYLVAVGPATSTDVSYDGVRGADVPVFNVGDDFFEIVVIPADGLITSEAGRSATFQVVLSIQPVADVSVPLATSDSTEGTVTPTQLIFTAGSLAAQSATVTGQADAVLDGDVAYSVTVGPATSADVSYDGLSGPDAQLTNVEP